MYLITTAFIWLLFPLHTVFCWIIRLVEFSKVFGSHVNPCSTKQYIQQHWLVLFFNTFFSHFNACILIFRHGGAGLPLMPVIRFTLLKTILPFKVKSFSWPSKFPHSPHIWSWYFSSTSICQQSAPTFTPEMIYNMITHNKQKQHLNLFNKDSFYWEKHFSCSFFGF